MNQDGVEKRKAPESRGYSYSCKNFNFGFILGLVLEMEELLQFGYHLDDLDSPLELEGLELLDFDFEIDALDLDFGEPNVIESPIENSAVAERQMCFQSTSTCGAIATASIGSCSSRPKNSGIDPTVCALPLQTVSLSSFNHVSHVEPQPSSIPNDISLPVRAGTVEPVVPSFNRCEVSPVGCHISDSNSSPISRDEARRRRAVRKEMLILKRTQGGRILPAASSADVEFEQVSKIAQLLLADGEKKMNQESDMNNSEPPFVVSVGSTLGEQVSNLDTCEEPLSPLHSKDDNLLSVAVNTQVFQDCKGSVSSKSQMQCRNESLVRAGSKGAATSPPQVVPKRDLSPANHSAYDPRLKDESGDAAKIISDHLAELPSGTDPESRRQRRLIRNRLSAALHRQRKRETLDTQKQIIESKDATIAKLKSQTLDVSIIPFSSSLAAASRFPSFSLSARFFLTHLFFFSYKLEINRWRQS